MALHCCFKVKGRWLGCNILPDKALLKIPFRLQNVVTVAPDPEYLTEFNKGLILA
jgi:hypothetical protein